MRENYSSYNVELQEKFKNLQSFITSIGIILGILGFFYLLFWIGAVNDDFILQQGKVIFDPLASLFFASDTSVDVYKNTGLALICAMLPIPIVNCILDKIKDGEDGDEYILFKSDSQYFSKSDWEAIVDVFKTLRPYSIDRSLRDGYDVVYIVFTERTEDGVKKHNNLYYRKDAEAVKCYEEYIWVGELEHIDGYWYIDQWSNEEIINATQET